MAGAKKARKRSRSLEQRLGTTGTDPFIPARQPQMAGTAPFSPITSVTNRRALQRGGRWAWARLLVGAVLVAVGIGAVVARPALAAQAGALGIHPQESATWGIALVAFALGMGFGWWGGQALRHANAEEDGDTD